MAAAISSLVSPNLLQQPYKLQSQTLKPSFPVLKAASFSHGFHPIFSSPNARRPLVISALAQEAPVASEGKRRLYVGNIPRTVTNEELARIVEEHGSVEKAEAEFIQDDLYVLQQVDPIETCGQGFMNVALTWGEFATECIFSNIKILSSIATHQDNEVMYDKYSGRSRRFAFVTMKSVDDANAAIEKLNDTEIGGRKIKVNITEKPLKSVDSSLLQAEDSKFIDSPHKVYVGNLSKTVTTEVLSKFFSAEGKVLSAKVSRVPGTSKSSGFGFVTFSSEADVEAAISAFNNSQLEGQKIRVNKA
ncbi:hypothetical protein ACLOJK_017389 [Asimina triloba]